MNILSNWQITGRPVKLRAVVGTNSRKEFHFGGGSCAAQCASGWLVGPVQKISINKSRDTAERNSLTLSKAAMIVANHKKE